MSNLNPFVKDMDAVKTQLDKLKVSGSVCVSAFSYACILGITACIIFRQEIFKEIIMIIVHYLKKVWKFLCYETFV